ncbi:MAG: putative Ig domain-containing protein, partial [Dehalococcoidales bacterium]|nr:putative Ig domain-containing protein [Dehalococcoidales bacterium]
LKIVNGPSIKTTALADGEVGFAYNDNLEVKDGVASYTWSLIAGDLPFGLTLDQDTGEISGVPSEALDQGILTFQVSDSMGGSATGNIPLTIHPAPEITTDSLPQGEVRMRYYQTLTASGGLLPYTWSIQSGTLPSGLSFSRGRGIISGTPRATCGSTPVTFEVKDKLGGTATRILGISVVPAPEITTDIQLADGEIGVAYTQTLFATDGVGPYIWTIISGRLPGGLSLDEDSGVISGTPVQATPGTVINIQATDSVGGYARKSFRMKISAAPKILTFRLAAGKVGGFYQQNLIASGGTGPFTWTIVDGSLPDGLNLDSTAGVISGTPLVQADNILITFMITDSYWMTDIKAISIKIY